MENSRLVRILKTFTKKEVRDLRKWLHSPAHNQRVDVLHLFEYLIEKNRISKEKYLAKEKVFPMIYPTETFDDALMRQVMHFLLKSTEEFLIYQELVKDQVRAKIILAEVFRQRQLTKSFQKTIHNAKQLQENYAYRNHRYFQNEYLLQFEEYNYLGGLKRTVPLNLQKVSNSNDMAYLASKLQISSIMLSHQAVFKADYEMGLLDDVLKYIEQKHLLNIPAIAIYYYSYKANAEREEESHFFNLKKEIEVNGKLFPVSEIRDIFLLTINYCIDRMNAGVKSFIREAFELYRKGFEAKILLDNNLISKWTFLNVVINGTLLKEFEWVEHFIKSYQCYLEEKYRENVVHYCLAKLNFEKRNYGAVMQMLIQYEYDDILMNLNAKTMLLKMYYEQDEYDALESLIGSMKTYIQRKQVMGYHKANFTNFLRMTKKIIKINPYSNQQKEKLRKEIETVNPMISTEKNWLLEQLNKL